MRKQCVSLLLLLALLAAGGCASDSAKQPTETNSDQAAAETTEIPTDPSLLSTLPAEMDFEGAEYRILVAGAIRDYDIAFLLAEESNGEILNDTALKCYSTVEELTNTNIIMEPADTLDVATIAARSVQAGEDVYQVVICNTSWTSLPNLIISDSLYNMLELPNLHTDAPYFYRNFNQNFIVNDQLYFICSSYPSAGALPIHMVFNKDMMKNMSLDYPYELVMDGKWTYDVFLQYISDVSADLNGDGKMDYYDQYGYSNLTDLTNILYSGWDVSMVKMLDTGAYAPDFQNEKLVSSIQRMLELRERAEVFDKTASEYVGQNNLHHFMTGNAMFSTTGTGALKLRAIEDFDFGILPFPKYDEKQEDYCSCLSMEILGIPATIQNPEMTGTVLEALSISFYEEMTNAYLDVYVENKVLRDEESITIARMLMDGNFACDLLQYFKFSNSVMSGYDLVAKVKDSGSIVSKMESFEKSVTKQADKFFSAFFD